MLEIACKQQVHNLGYLAKHRIAYETPQGLRQYFSSILSDISFTNAKLIEIGISSVDMFKRIGDVVCRNMSIKNSSQENIFSMLTYVREWTTFRPSTLPA
jgi:hypothetical protein